MVGELNAFSFCFSVRIRGDMVSPMRTVPKDGSIVYIMDKFGHVDLARWEKDEWNAEMGNCDVNELNGWSPFYIGSASSLFDNQGAE